MTPNSPQKLSQRLSLIFTTISRPECAKALIASAKTAYPWLPIHIADQGIGEEMQQYCREAGVHYHRLPFDSGLSAARNHLVRNIDTDYFILADDDFELDPGLPIELAIDFLDAHADFLCVGGGLDDYREVDDKMDAFVRPRGHNIAIDEAGGGIILIRHLAFGTNQLEFQGATFKICDHVPNWGVFRRGSFFSQNLWWDENFKVGGEHLDFFLRVKLSEPSLRVSFLESFKCRHLQRRSEDYGKLRLRSDWIEAFRQKWNFRYFHEIGGPVRYFDNYRNPVVVETLQGRRVASVEFQNERLKASVEKLRERNAHLVTRLATLASKHKQLGERYREKAAPAQNSRKVERGALNGTPEWAHGFGNENPRHLDRWFHVSLKHNYIYCEVPKCGCSTIKQTLTRLELDDPTLVPEDQNAIHDPANFPLQRPSKVANFAELIESNQTFRFCFVRNPFTRLLSAYLDKVVRGGPQKRLILRALGRPEADLDQEITFDEFVDALARDEQATMNGHWALQTRLSCWEKITYDFVGRFEELDTDLHKAGQRIASNFSDYTYVEMRHATGAAQRLKEFYDKRLIQVVATIFRPDFEAFNYPAELPSDNALG